jgi:hypothetical protein
VFENKVLRRIFGRKRGITEGWRKLCEELLHLYSSPGFVTAIK